MSRRARPWAFIVTLTVLMSWTTLTVFESLAPNALTDRAPLATATRDAITTLAAQRWEFFTASQQEIQLIAYDAETKKPLLRLPQTKAVNGFGISRIQRAQGPEIAQLHGKVQHWTECASRTDSAPCFDEASTTPPEKIHNDANWKSICGEVFLTQEKPTPFEFRDFTLPDASVIQVARVSVSCN